MYGHKILRKYGKRVETKSQKVLGAKSYICTSYTGKTGRRGGGGSFYPHILNRVKSLSFSIGM